jgi:hypothetical protein
VWRGAARNSSERIRRSHGRTARGTPGEDFLAGSQFLARGQRNALRLRALRLRHAQPEQAVLIVRLGPIRVHITGEPERALEAPASSLAEQVLALLGARRILAANGHLVTQDRDVHGIRGQARQDRLDDEVIAVRVHIEQ